MAKNSTPSSIQIDGKTIDGTWRYAVSGKNDVYAIFFNPADPTQYVSVSRDDWGGTTAEKLRDITYTNTRNPEVSPNSVPDLIQKANQDYQLQQGELAKQRAAEGITSIVTPAPQTSFTDTRNDPNYHPSTDQQIADQNALTDRQNSKVANEGSTPATVASSSRVPASQQPNGQGISPIASLPNLGPGSSGTDVKSLQDWLVQNGYMTAAQAATGPGVYGPQTMAAVAAWQKASGIDTQGNPGYFGPASKTYLASSAAPGNGGSTGMGAASTPGQAATGNPALDKILASLQGLITANKAAIPAGLQITPALTQQFLAWAHQVVDPQTKQLIQTEITNINASSKNLATQYGASRDQLIQDFGTNLATEQNNAGASGTAFSGLRNLGEKNMVASTNRSLASLQAKNEYDIGQGLRTAAANVGSANAGGINTPFLLGGTVSNTGGSRGRFDAGNSLNFSYNPSLYTAGVIPTNQNTALNNQEGNYISQYGTLAGNNSGRSMSDLIGMMGGLPSGYTIPSNLK